MDKIKERVQELYDQLANFTTNGFSYFQEQTEDLKIQMLDEIIAINKKIIELEKLL